MQPQQGRPHPMRWMWAGLGVMFVLIGAAAVIAVLYPSPTGGSPNPMTGYSYDFGWVWGLVGLFFGLFFLVWIFGRIFGGWGWMRYRYRRWGYYGDEYSILRERYAKGEITKDQFDQMTRDLQEHEGNR